MFQDGVFVSGETIQRFPSLRTELMRAMGFLAPEAAPQPAGEDAADAPAVDESFAQLSPGEARKLLAGCSDRVKKALAAMAAGDEPFFMRKDVAEALGADEDGLAGVWAGLTRRTRTVTGNPESYLISWRRVRDRWGGDLTPVTHRSLRLVLQID